MAAPLVPPLEHRVLHPFRADPSADTLSPAPRFRSTLQHPPPSSLHLAEVARVPHDLLHISYFVPQLLYRASVDFGRGLARRQRRPCGGCGRGCRREYLSSCRRRYSDTFKIDRPAFTLRFVSLEGGLGGVAAPEKNRSVYEQMKDKRGEKRGNGEGESEAAKALHEF